MDLTRARGPLIALAGTAGTLVVLQLAGADLTTLVPRSPLGLAVAAGIAAAVVGWSALARRVVAHRVLRGAVIAVPVLLLSAWLVVPLLQDRAVEEDLLSLVPAPAAADASPGPSGAARATVAPAEPQVRTLGSGALRGLDGHEATGTASVLEAAGAVFVRVADLDSTRSPDVRVWLVPAGQVAPSAGGVDLGGLKGNVGSANYAVPPGTDVGQYGTVLLWCRAFSTPIGAADLA